MNCRKLIREYGIITVGIFIVSAAIYFFMIPGQVIIGSISGLVVVLNHFIPLTVSMLTFILNVALLGIGVLFLGKEFGAKTVYASIMMPVFLYLFEVFFPNNPSLTNDIIIDTVCYLFVASIGQAMLFHVNASAGGTDIVAKLMNKYLRVELGKGIAIVGMCIALTSILIYDTKSLILGILATYVKGMVLDNFIDGFNQRKRVSILSDEHEKLQDFIVNQLQRGVTLYQAVGGYKHDEKVEVVTILTRSEYASLINFLHTLDERAFVTVSTVNEVVGNWKRKKRGRYLWEKFGHS